MFDFHEISKKHTDKIMDKWNVDTDPIYSTRFKKFIKFLGYSLFPFILSVASFIIMIVILNRIYDMSGMKGVVIIGLTIIIFSLRGLSSEIKKITS